MLCALCHQPVDLFTLDPIGYEGLPAHADCAAPVRALNASLLLELEAMIRAEPNPQRHRQGAR